MSVAKNPSNIEGKYTVDGGDHLVLSMLRSLCRSDPEFPGDYISSVYFDTPTLTLLDQKAQSEYHKNKVRLRWYGMPDKDTSDVPAYLEIKQKKGVQRIKARKRLAIPARHLMPGKEALDRLMSIAHQVPDLGWTPVGALFPMIVVRYYRHRFTDFTTGARISLDCNIHYSRVNGVFFPETAPRTLRHGVLEIKSKTGDIPPSIQSIKSRLNTRDSFSKYEECWRMYASTTYRRELTSSRYD